MINCFLLKILFFTVKNISKYGSKNKLQKFVCGKNISKLVPKHHLKIQCCLFPLLPIVFRVCAPYIPVSSKERHDVDSVLFFANNFMYLMSIYHHSLRSSILRLIYGKTVPRTAPSVFQCMLVYMYICVKSSSFKTSACMCKQCLQGDEFSASMPANRD